MDIPTEFLGGVAWSSPQIVRVLHGVVGETRDPVKVDWLSILPTHYITDKHPTRYRLGRARPSKGCRWHCYYPKNA